MVAIAVIAFFWWMYHKVRFAVKLKLLYMYRERERVTCNENVNSGSKKPLNDWGRENQIFIISYVIN